MDAATYLQMRRVEDAHWWFRARSRIIQSVVSRLDLPRSPRILDVGCGTGGTLESLARFGPVVGVETDEHALEMARQRNVGSVYKGSLPDAMPRESHEADLVVMADVLEHIDEDVRSLATIRAMMNPGAKIVITVPAFPMLWGPYDVQAHHKRRYRAGTLRAAIEGAGLRVEHLTYYNTILFPLMAAARLIDRTWPKAGGNDDLDVPPRVLNGTLEAIFASERHVVPHWRLPFGVSLLAVASNG